MPNYVKNVLKMRGIADEPLFNDEGGFDFNTLIPMPAELDIEDGSIITDALSALVLKLMPHLAWLGAQEDTKAFQSKMKDRASRNGKPDDTLAEKGLVYARNIVAHGYPAWYGWRNAKWGTKWNATLTEVPDHNTVCFETAWSDPSPVIEALGKRYPDRIIEHWWADEDVGYNTGYREIENGEVSEAYYPGESQEAYETYGFCWGEDVEDGEYLFRGEDGLIHVRQPE